MATRFYLGGLNDVVDALDQAVGDFGIEPFQHAVATLLDGLRQFLHRLEARSYCPAVPAIEDELAQSWDGALVDFLECKAEPIGRPVLRCIPVSASSRAALCVC